MAASFFYAYTVVMADVSQHGIPGLLKPDVERLLAISPLFSALLRGLSGEDVRELVRPAPEARLPDASADWIPPCDSDDPTTCMAHLRRAKQRGLAHIVWWELGLRGDVGTSYRAISDFAAGLIRQALGMAERVLAPRFGHPDGGRFSVIGLGKLGGRELNLGSDVDLLFVFASPEGTMTTGGRKQATAADYYAHLSRMLIRLLSEHTGDGIVWPVDMRLRPGGDGAAIAMSLDATLDYYRTYGQTWERAMLIKARPVAGDAALGEAFVRGVAPFVYRRYLDYTTVTALADMKRRIDAVAGQRPPGDGFDVKRGQGGIREIEFVIQSMQLLHGGVNPDLRASGSLPALSALAGFGAIRDDAARDLRSAYLFWRRVEHALQAKNGEQTQKLPADYATYLGAALGESDVPARMRAHAELVRRLFSEYVLPVAAGDSESWLAGGHAGACERLDDASQRRVKSALARIDEHLLRGVLPERSRRQVEAILQRAMPRWLDDANGVAALEALADLLINISGRATWIDFLATHEGAQDWLIGVLSASRYVREHIVRDPSWLEWPLAEERGAADISAICSALDALDMQDAEFALARLGRLVDRARLTAALSVDAHLARPELVGGWLADVADATTRAALRLCLHQLGLPQDFPFVALALGRHGSREMGLASDLDMVFVLAHDHPSEMTGRHSVWEWAHRLGRRLIQRLTDSPPFGAGFAFDARLRPSGESGVLVTNLAGFRDYQLHQAQTWEHQALCRARAVAGPAAARHAAADVVAEVLDLPRDKGALADDVLAMRRKMLAHLASKSADIINLKQDAGGLVDIDFLAQYARLAFGGGEPGVVNTLRALPQRAPGAWRDWGGKLADVYVKYRQMENALRVELGESVARLPADAQAPAWETMRRHAEIHSPETLRETMRETHDAFCKLLRNGTT